MKETRLLMGMPITAEIVDDGANAQDINKIFEYLPNELKNEKLIQVITERISKFSDIKEMLARGELDFFFKATEYSKEKLIFKDTPIENITTNLQNVVNELTKIPETEFTKENIKNVLMAMAEKLPSKGELLHPVRFALSGLDKSPDPFTIAEILGKNETLSRLQKAI